jgi:OsmC subfamily peroxiredoxin
MTAVHRTAEIDWTGSIARGSGCASGRSGAIGDLPITVASRFGEPAGKTSPEELVAAAHAACFTMALGSILAREGTPPEPLQVTATVTLETSGTPTIASSQLEGPCCVVPTRGMLKPSVPPLSDREGELVEGDRHAPVHRRLDRQLVVASPEVLYEGVPRDHYAGAVVLLQASHRP